MRVGALRTDIQKVYLNDVESRVQRCFSSEPPGQSRYYVKPSDSELLAVLNANAPVTLNGTNAGATFNTAAGANVLVIKDAATGSNATITVTSNAATPIATIISELNAGFLANGLRLTARNSGANRVFIDSTGTNKGPSAYIKVDATSTLETVLGLSTTAKTGLSVSALKTAIYPTASSINVSSANILALSTFQYLTTGAQTALVDAIADLVAPELIETGPVLLSFVYGNLSGFASASFQPGGARVGLPAGAALFCLQDDGSTPFSV